MKASLGGKGFALRAIAANSAAPGLPISHVGVRDALAAADRPSRYRDVGPKITRLLSRIVEWQEGRGKPGVAPMPQAGPMKGEQAARRGPPHGNQPRCGGRWRAAPSGDVAGQRCSEFPSCQGPAGSPGSAAFVIFSPPGRTPGQMQGEYPVLNSDANARPSPVHERPTCLTYAQPAARLGLLSGGRGQG